MKKNIFMYSVLFTMLTTFLNTDSQASSRAAASSDHSAAAAPQAFPWTKRQWLDFRGDISSLEHGLDRDGLEWSKIHELNRAIWHVLSDMWDDNAIPFGLLKEVSCPPAGVKPMSLAPIYLRELRDMQLPQNLEDKIKEGHEQLTILRDAHERLIAGRGRLPGGSNLQQDMENNDLIPDRH